MTSAFVVYQYLIFKIHWSIFIYVSSTPVYILVTKILRPAAPSEQYTDIPVYFKNKVVGFCFQVPTGLMLGCESQTRCYIIVSIYSFALVRSRLRLSQSTYFTSVDPISPPSKIQPALPVSAYPRNDLAYLQLCSLGGCICGGGAGYCAPVLHVFEYPSTTISLFIFSLPTPFLSYPKKILHKQNLQVYHFLLQLRQ